MVESIGIGLVVLLLIRLERRQSNKSRLIPTITEVLSSAGAYPKSEAAKHGCCS